MWGLQSVSAKPTMLGAAINVCLTVRPSKEQLEGSANRNADVRRVIRSIRRHLLVKLTVLCKQGTPVLEFQERSVNVMRDIHGPVAPAKRR